MTMSLRLVLIIVVALFASPSLALAQAFPTFSTEPGIDRPGGDFDTWVVDGNHKEAWRCHDSCFANPRCKAYTFVAPTTPEGNGLCRLKDSVPAPVASNCCVSGVKGQRGAGAAAKPAEPVTPVLNAVWELLCQSSMPPPADATNRFNGRLRINLAADGSLTGSVEDSPRGPLSLTGKRAADGKASGEIILADGARMPWSGEIKRASNGALSGTGTFGTGGVPAAAFYPGRTCMHVSWMSR